MYTMRTRRGVARNEGQDTSRRRGKRRRVRRRLRTSSRRDEGTGVISADVSGRSSRGCGDGVSRSSARDSASEARLSRDGDLPRFIADTN